MGTPRRSLQIDEDLAFQRREWQVQRIAWWVLTAFVVAALLGLFGGGPLSRTAAVDATGALRVEYERFLRVGTHQRLVIRARVAKPGDQPLRLQIDRGYFDAMKVERVQPEPDSMDIGPGEVTFQFGPAAPGEIAILIDAEPRHAGRQQTLIRAGTGSAVAIRQFIYF